MPLTFGLSSVRELFAKLKRDANLLDAEVTSDRLFNFVVTGYSMIDWVRNDPSVPASAKAENEVNLLRVDPWLKVCGDLATACKHFSFTRRVPITQSADAREGYGCGRFGKGTYGVGESSIEIQMNDGTAFSGLDLVNGVISKWQAFFEAHGVISETRQV
jgi:hypothetical protein